MSSCAVEMRNVTFSYGKESFIDNFSVEFPRGQVISIIGPNGCGKSTMVKLIDGILHPCSGEVFVEGVPMLSVSPKERARRVAVLAQSGRLPAMTVEQLVACGRYPYRSQQGRLSGEDKDHIDYAFELVGMEQFRHHEVRCLSGGERQRAFVAMTLAQDTNILILDEPTTYLDVRACHDLMHLVQRLNREQNKTILMVIHDLDLALRYSDRLLVMQRGSVQCVGSVQEVLQSRAIERVFDVEICSHETHKGQAYTMFATR